MRPDLALEIKLHIADHLPSAALASVCATSRMHHVQLMPSLYWHIELPHDENGTRRAIALLEILCLSPSSPSSLDLSTHPEGLLRELKLWLWLRGEENALESGKQLCRLQELLRDALFQTVHHSADKQSLLRHGVFHLRPLFQSWSRRSGPAAYRPIFRVLGGSSRLSI
ncbi:hypothetical protein FB45DRAFT_1036032 [Roridomyces roridus]|uniref:Uncharacterized protein n=1 Tax=Roridomyces roridus TaxID=1738132 RepID=A0AAD7B9Y2_9AGAR|nr:hypothetical protein FB45DRAFT_1036032 [Roridomyces roridus]